MAKLNDKKLIQSLLVTLREETNEQNLKKLKLSRDELMYNLGKRTGKNDIISAIENALKEEESDVYYRTELVQAEKYDKSKEQAKRWGLKQMEYDNPDDWYISFEQIDPLPDDGYLVREDGQVHFYSIDYFNEKYHKL